MGKEKNFLPQHNVTRPGEVKHNVYKGKEELSSIRMKWIIKEQYSQNEEAIADVLREYLNIILIENIRMKLGNTYSIYSSTNLDILLGELSLGISFSCDPNKVDESIAEIIKDINAIDSGNINLDILSKAKKSLQKSI